MKEILVFLGVMLVAVVMAIVVSCRPAAPVNYHVTVKTIDGAILYEDEKPSLRASIFYQSLIRGIATVKVEYQGVYLFEATGSDLLVTRERVEKGK